MVGNNPADGVTKKYSDMNDKSMLIIKNNIYIIKFLNKNSTRKWAVPRALSKFIESDYTINNDIKRFINPLCIIKVVNGVHICSANIVRIG